MPRFSRPRRMPHGVTLIGRLFDEGTLGRAGIALEKALGVANRSPARLRVGACPYGARGLGKPWMP